MINRMSRMRNTDFRCNSNPSVNNSTNNLNNNMGNNYNGILNNIPDNGMGNNITNNANNRRLLKRLQILDFSIVDTVLYLDAYPNCRKALDYYQKLLSERESVANMLADNGAPVNVMSNRSQEWKWIDSPWPWEYEANV